MCIYIIKIIITKDNNRFYDFIGRKMLFIKNFLYQKFKINFFQLSIVLQKKSILDGKEIESIAKRIR